MQKARTAAGAMLRANRHMGPWAQAPIGPCAHVYYAYYAYSAYSAYYAWRVLVAIHVLLTLWSAPSVPKWPFPIPKRPLPVQVTFSSLQSEPTESTTYMVYLITMRSIPTLPTPPPLRFPLPHLGPSLTMSLVTKGGQRVPRSPTSQISQLHRKPTT